MFFVWNAVVFIGKTKRPVVSLLFCMSLSFGSGRSKLTNEKCLSYVCLLHFTMLVLFSRSLGVHISFVRSIAMDSWTDQQLAMMKNGGNDKLNSYLEQNGINRRTPIKQKYESDVAQLYKLRFKARVEGKPEPTELPKTTRKARPSSSSGGGGDANGMERLPGESDQQYIARQTRLRDEARARMAAKFGGSGMGGVGAGSRSSMQGIGSDPNYNPHGASASSSGVFGVDSLVSGLGSAIISAGSVANSVKNSVLSEDNMNAVRSTSSSFWGSLTAGVSTVASSVSSSGVDQPDGLADLQREIASQKPSQSVYSGVGSDSFRKSSVNPASLPTVPTSSAAPSSSLKEAQGLPGEDRNGIVRLTGETDEQYVLRQTRLRDEARARMAAKFGGQGMSSSSASSGVSSSSMGSASNITPSAAPPTVVSEAPGLPGEDRNGIARLTGETDEQYVVRQTRLREEARARMAAKFGTAGGAGLSSAGSSSAPRSAPSSGNAAPSWLSQQPAPATASGGLNSNDFFASFGS